MSASLYEKTLAVEAADRADIVVLTAENRAHIRSLPELLGDRFVDVGIAEQTLVGAAAGLALRGRTPVVHALAPFLTMRAFEFIRTDVGLPGLPVKFVGFIPGLLSEANGPTHQALEDVALMRTIPGMTVLCPADEQETSEALVAALRSPGPCYLRYNPRPARVPHREPFLIGRVEVLRRGSDVALVAYGPLVAEAYEAALLLAAEGISARVLNLRTVNPIDERALLAAAQETRLLVTVEDHFARGGLRSALAELLVERRIAADVLTIAFEERWFRPLPLGALLEAEGLTPEAIASRARSRLAHRTEPGRTASSREATASSH